MVEKSKHLHIKYKICVSGAAETGHCSADALLKAKELGREVVRQSAILVTGATTGFPLWSAMGAKEEKGISIGLSPASTEREHVEHYKLPVDYFDMIIYTGFGYSGRNLFLTRTADAVIVGCGRMGTLNEFTIAFEDDKPIGVLVGAGGTADMIKDIIEKSHRTSSKIVFDADPKNLVKKVLDLVHKEKVVVIEGGK
jgi:hypothetical protein